MLAWAASLNTPDWMASTVVYILIVLEAEKSRIQVLAGLVVGVVGLPSWFVDGHLPTLSPHCRVSETADSGMSSFSQKGSSSVGSQPHLPLITPYWPYPQLEHWAWGFSI